MKSERECTQGVTQGLETPGHVVPVAALLLQDIYIARAEGELQLEEELFYLLLKIYKTPKLLNELTRLSQQQASHHTA